MYEIWYDYVNPKYDEKAKLYYIDTDVVYFNVDIKTDDIYVDIAEDFETRYDTSNYELHRPVPKGKNKKVIGLMKELAGKIVLQLLTDDSSKDKKAKSPKKCVIKRKLKFENYETVQNQLNLIIKSFIQIKKELNIDSIKKIIKNS